MRLLTIVPALTLLALGLTACEDKQAQNNTPTKPTTTQTEPQTDQSAPASQHPKP